MPRVAYIICYHNFHKWKTISLKNNISFTPAILRRFPRADTQNEKLFYLWFIYELQVLIINGIEMSQNIHTYLHVQFQSIYSYLHTFILHS